MKKKTAPVQNFTEPMIKVGCDAKSVESARAAINDILASPAADAAKVKALEILGTLCGSQSVTISHCHLQQGGPT